MNDSRFIELLNLYVDHQISAEDAARLETEIQRSPARRRIYRQYCQMQRACTLLAENFRAEAPAGGKIVDFVPVPRRGFAPVAYTVGALAAAACLALVIVRKPAPESAPTAPSVAAVVAAEPASEPAPAMRVAPLPARVALQPVFAGFEPTNQQTSLAFADTNQVRLDWMDRVQLRKLSTEELWLEQRPTSQPQDLLFKSPRRFQGQTEMTAWRFQK